MPAIIFLTTPKALVADGWLSKVGSTVFKKGTAPLQTHEHAMAAAVSRALLGASLLGACFTRLIAWPVTAVGAFLGGWHGARDPIHALRRQA